MRALALAAALVPAWPAVGEAHGVLRRAVPASGARLTTPPAALRLTFNERPELAVARIGLRGPAGVIALGALALHGERGRTLVAPVTGAMPGGTYTVTWQIAGGDGHPVRGEYRFVLADPPPAAERAAGAAPSTRPPAPPSSGAAPEQPIAPRPDPAPASAPQAASPPAASDGFDAGAPGYVAVRWLTYLALLPVIGAATFVAVVLPGAARRLAQAPEADHTGSADAWLADAWLAEARRGAARLGLVSAVAFAVLALPRLVAQLAALGGPDGAPPLVGLLTGTTWGWGWLMQIAGAALAALGFARLRAARRAPAGAGWTLAAVGAVLAGAAPALAGHAAGATEVRALALLGDVLHVLGAGGWIGTLLVVLAVGVPAARAADAPPVHRAGDAARRRVGALVRAFSPAALACAAAVALTGVFAAWLHVGRPDALWSTGYGRVLLAKLAALVAVAGAGAYNWRRVRPALAAMDTDGADHATRQLHGAGRIELGAAVVVLLLTAVLVATPPPGELHGERVATDMDR